MFDKGRLDKECESCFFFFILLIYRKRIGLIVWSVFFNIIDIIFFMIGCLGNVYVIVN